MLEATFIGYATYYLVRNSVAPVAIEMQNALGYTKEQIGNIMAITAISYGLSKFVMGVLSDRSDAAEVHGHRPASYRRHQLRFRRHDRLLDPFLAVGPQRIRAGHGLAAVRADDGALVQRVGARPHLQHLEHLAQRRRRPSRASLAAWAVSTFGGWQYAFYVPAVIAIVGAFYLLLRLRDTPQSVGLPPIEEYRNDYPASVDKSCDRRGTRPDGP